MRVPKILFVLLEALTAVEAATPCKKDNCYSAVAVQNKSNPQTAIRKADCSSVLRTIIDDSKTITITKKLTVTPSTVWVVETGASYVAKANRTTPSSLDAQVTPPPSVIAPDSGALFPRDQIIAAGKVPQYASSCKNLQDYAIACLCFGVKAATYKIVPRTVTSTTIASTATATSTIALGDIAYLRENGQEFCTSFNNYVPGRTTQGVVATIEETTTTVTETTVLATPEAVTETVVVLSSIPPIRRRDGVTTDSAPIAIETYQVIYQYPGNHTELISATITKHITDGVHATPVVEGIVKREVVPTPASMTGWVAARISAACNMVAVGIVTETETVGASTIYVSTITEVLTATSIVETPTTFVTSTATAAPSPTVIAGNTGPGGSPRVYHNEYFQLELPFAIGAFGDYSTNVFVSTTGVISINSGASSPWNDWYPLPTDELPDVSICGLWDHYYIYQGWGLGIYYVIEGQAPKRTVTFDYTMSTYNWGHEHYLFSITFAEDQPGVVLIKYKLVWDHGYTGTVGAQRLSTNESIAYSESERKLDSNTFVRMDTEAGTVTTGSL